MSMIGKTLGTFECTALLGKGGMGEVYQAKDQKLGRDVAIKVLPEEFAKDTDRVARFQREAKLLASLNHPNIAAIHGLEEADGTHFLVLELIEGDTLADRIKSGPIPVEESLKLALQIAEALEAAHEKGVIHRDLKPANIKVTPDSKVKVLDFGLAKAFAGDSEDVNLSNSPTLSAAATQQGVILGTAAYMSPEQARGKSVDKRADIWAFGVVLSEMLTGHCVFAGDDVSQTLARVLEREPDFSTLPPNLHPRIRLLLERCLKKEFKDRYGSISDARVDIQEVLANPQGIFALPSPGSESRPGFRTMLPWVVAVLGIIIGGTAIWNQRNPMPLSVVRFSYDLPKGQQFINTDGANVAISPDGSQFAYSTTEGIYLRSMSDMHAKRIAGTSSNTTQPFFSPDGKWIGYISESDSQLKKIPVDGGIPVTLCDATNSTTFGMSWGNDNRIVFSQYPNGIMRISADGGTPECLIKAFITEDFGLPIFPQILPDGKNILFTSDSDPTHLVTQIAVQSLESGEQKVLFKGKNARYLSTGHLVYIFENNLVAAPFDIDQFEKTGESVPLIEGVKQFGISDSGTLVYASEFANAPEPQRTLMWVDKRGNEEPIAALPQDYSSPKISPDGMSVALVSSSNGNEDIWIWEFFRETRRRLTTNEFLDRSPIWTSDGQKIVFASSREGEMGTYWTPADGIGKVERLCLEFGRWLLPYSWVSDGNMLVLETRISKSDIEIYSVKNDTRRALLQGEYYETQPQISPNEKWMAYTSNESGRNEIYVRSFPEIDKAFKQISTDGGDSPLWSPDDSRLYYRDGDRVMAVALETEPKLIPGKPEELFRGTYYRQANGLSWDIHPDGDRFLMIKPFRTEDESTSGTPRQINVVLNWFEELKDRVPTD